MEKFHGCPRLENIKTDFKWRTGKIWAKNFVKHPLWWRCFSNKANVKTSSFSDPIKALRWSLYRQNEIFYNNWCTESKTIILLPLACIRTWNNLPCDRTDIAPHRMKVRKIIGNSTFCSVSVHSLIVETFSSVTINSWYR